jgi:lathosterol oxidase
MDIVLNLFDSHLGLDALYATLFPTGSTSKVFDFMMRMGSDQNSALGRENIYRQAFSLFWITWGLGIIMYFILATYSYYFIFDHRTMKHPKFLKNQIRMEIVQSLISTPIMVGLTIPIFLLELRGYGKLYENISDHGWGYFFLQFPLILLFTEYLSYYLHRSLHEVPFLYTWIHKSHHRLVMPTPFASLAFSPIDGFVQSLPYHFFPMIFPFHKYAYIALFTFINIWTLYIHDGDYWSTHPIINGSASHTIHHAKFKCNYGQFLTIFDRLGGSYVAPNPELFSQSLEKGRQEQETIGSLKEEMVKMNETDEDPLVKSIVKRTLEQKKEI